MKLNKFKRVLPHTLRIVTMGVATTVAGIAMASCEKDDIEPEIIPTKVYDYHFYPTVESGKIEEARGGVKDDIEIITDVDYLKQLVKDPTTKDVNLIAVGDFRILPAEALKIVRNFLEKRMDISQKIKGKGAINTEPGIASQVPADSAALAGMGYIVGCHQR